MIIDPGLCFVVDRNGYLRSFAWDAQIYVQRSNTLARFRLGLNSCKNRIYEDLRATSGGGLENSLREHASTNEKGDPLQCVPVYGLWVGFGIVITKHQGIQDIFGERTIITGGGIIESLKPVNHL
jgi:hypothetical protein